MNKRNGFHFTFRIHRSEFSSSLAAVFSRKGAPWRAGVGENTGLFEHPASRINLRIGMNEASEQALQRAIATIGQSDPIIKLLQQVKLGRMKPTDAGLRAITDSWIETYQHVLETVTVDRPALIRLNPGPRLAVLIEAGVLTPDHQGVVSLQAAYHAAVQRVQA
jgi:hypothetical protein